MIVRCVHCNHSQSFVLTRRFCLFRQEGLQFCSYCCSLVIVAGVFLSVCICVAAFIRRIFVRLPYLHFPGCHSLYFKMHRYSYDNSSQTIRHALKISNDPLLKTKSALWYARTSSCVHNGVGLNGPRFMLLTMIRETVRYRQIRELKYKVPPLPSQQV